MKILITGGNGQLGRDCTSVFEKNHSVTSVDIDTTDITDIEAVSDLIADIKPDVIVNCAAYTQVDNSETQQKVAWAANVKGPENLAVCARKSAARLIHISTDYVFDGKKIPPEPYIETDETNPQSYYGRTKLEGEKVIPNHTDNFMILRTAWLYGFYGNNFLKAILKKSLIGQSLKVINDQYGSPTWSYGLAEQIRHVIDHNARGIYHASSEGHCTWYELAKYFLEKMDITHDIRPCATEEYPLPAPRPKNSILKNHRLKSEGLNIMKHWQEDLDEYIVKFGARLIEECSEK
jgi:dTDP-4-dehydrorhamnose reductase